MAEGQVDLDLLEKGLDSVKQTEPGLWGYLRGLSADPYNPGGDMHAYSMAEEQTALAKSANGGNVFIVPSEGDLRVEVYMGNTDIGFVKAGQEAAIKVDAFPFTRYGTLHGRVIQVATDAIDEQDARRAQANAANLANSGNTAQPATPGQPQNFVFLVTLSLDERAMKIGDAVIPLTPGMMVTAEVKTESRRVIDYLFSPLAKVASEALHEK